CGPRPHSFAFILLPPPLARRTDLSEQRHTIITASSGPLYFLILVSYDFILHITLPCVTLFTAHIIKVTLPKMRSKFKDEHPFEKRKAEAERIRQKYADRIPVICEKVEKSDITTIDKKKYLVPSDLTVGQFVYVIRKRIKLSPEKAIFIFVEEVLPPTAALMSSIYEEHKDDDGQVTYAGILFLVDVLTGIGFYTLRTPARIPLVLSEGCSDH
ncbi:hypothetical protein L249_6014, partial [Ophiocordyceps polyrhachis-furcata BCC 54312]